MEAMTAAAAHHRPLAIARLAVARAERGEAIAVELEAPARPVLERLLDDGALRRVLLWIERDGQHARIAARPRKAGGATTITELFEEDHRRLDELAAELRRVARGEPMRAIVLSGLFTSGLRRHLRIEETLVLPLHAARTRYATTSALVHEEHEAILTYVERMEREADGLRLASRRETTVSRLLDAEAGLAAILAQHNMNEEGHLFPLLDHTTPRAAREPLLRRIVTF
jgi:hemerythrin-like domain-containing protein